MDVLECIHWDASRPPKSFVLPGNHGIKHFNATPIGVIGIGWLQQLDQFQSNFSSESFEERWDGISVQVEYVASSGRVCYT